MRAAVDNDVLIKAASYGLLEELVVEALGGKSEPCVLGTAKYVVPQRIKRQRLTSGPDAALAGFGNLIKRVFILEPTAIEIEMAAALELSAQFAGISLDAGESQLSAMAVHRALSLLVTGDKRAIEALEVLLHQHPELSALCGKVRCLEQAVLRALGAAGSAGTLRAAICSEPQIDKALTACFVCHTDQPSEGDFEAGLQSYIAEMRKRANRILEA